MIESTDQMIKHFMGVSWEPLYVSTAIRNTWILNHMTFTRGGHTCNISFKDMVGGVWLAEYFLINQPYCRDSALFIISECLSKSEV